jgi:outer membrane protein assembly factor BamD (BamD/ComL family)
VRRLFFFMLLLTCCFSACARYKADHDVDLENADRFFREKKYPEAIVSYDRIAKDSPRSERGAQALYDVAFTHAFYDNPHKDYMLALQGFDEFLRVYPNDDRASEARNWRSILKIVLELKKENEHLAKSIEELKRIDIRHEERRKGK